MLIMGVTQLIILSPAVWKYTFLADLSFHIWRQGSTLPIMLISILRDKINVLDRMVAVMWKIHFSKSY